jgi:vacuolar protein-sorting-associated protein 4
LHVHVRVRTDSMATGSPLEKGIAYAEQAAEADTANDLHKALDLYRLSLEFLNHARKYAQSPLVAARIADAMLPRLQRAEELKAQLYESTAASSGKNGAVITGSDQTRKDADERKTSLGSTALSERPTTRLRDVAGLEDVKQALREAVLLPMQAPHLLRGRACPWKGILMYGPPGTGKTHIARAIAGEAGCAFFSVSASDLINKYYGESEARVRGLYEMAREQRPSIIFVDEIESVVPVRGGSSGEGGGGGVSSHMDRVVTEFLKQVDGLGIDNTGILTLAATNLPWQIDSAALRRFERRIYVPLPDEEARAAMVTPDMIKVGATPAQILDLVSATAGYSGSDIKNLLKDGDMRCLRRVLDATHYCPSPTESGAYVPCGDGDGDGITASTYDAWPNKATLRCPPSTPQDYLDALQAVKSSVKQAGLALFERWEPTK